MAPANWLKIYRPASMGLNLPETNNPIVTAGFTCAPER